MPLSDHEKRLLDEIEQTLRTDDPELASSMRAARPLTRTRTLIALSLLGLLGGFGLLIAGLQPTGVTGTILGVLGFAFVVAGSDCGLRAISRIRRGRVDRRGPRSARGPGSAPAK